MTAADASVPRAQICEQMKAAAADAIAVIASVTMSMLDDDEPCELEGEEVAIRLRLPIRLAPYTWRDVL
jgi:hypothetical protein